MTEQEALRLLALPDKRVIRRFAWTLEASGHLPKRSVFESGIQSGAEVLEGITFRVHYRGPKHILRGLASIEVPESFSCAIFAGQDRIAAIDTNPGQKHSNRVGAGRPYFGQTVDSDTHRHVWIGEYGYVEPVDPSILDVASLVRFFAKECNLTITGIVEDPRKGEQGTLL
ncbi:hypothetical protein [Paraburkholderia atlantica]|uniref:hypothetical protein n=1 Tax=Paraburkholderia atlantica TaxID=2654982 RepID=UPI00035F57CE|nr:hypothetical protein [Paraburkholderia atlantica]